MSVAVKASVYAALARHGSFGVCRMVNVKMSDFQIHAVHRVMILPLAGLTGVVGLPYSS